MKSNNFKKYLEELCDLLIKCTIKSPLPGFAFNEISYHELKLVTSQILEFLFKNFSKYSTLFSPENPINLIQTFMDCENNKNWIQPKKYIGFPFRFEASSIGRFITSINNNLNKFQIDSSSNLAYKLQNILNSFATINRQTSDGGNCYIATLVFQSYEAPQVKVLRKFRDEILLKSHYGRKFVDYYYSIGPKIISYLKNKSFINFLIRIILSIVVYIFNLSKLIFGEKNDF